MLFRRLLTSQAIAFLTILWLALGMRAVVADPDRWQREGWKTDFTRSLVGFEEILSGGPPKDGIPSIDQPTFAQPSEVTELAPQEPVIQFVHDGDARAYPLRILMWHEIVNDVVGGVPVGVTYCPLCNASVVFDRRVGDAVLDFGTTGKLRKSDLVMYDRQSESWWQQFTGEAIVGSHVGKTLAMLPARVVSFQAFASQYANGKVLIPDANSTRPYGKNPYVKYDSRSAPYPFFTDALPDDIAPMARVVVVRSTPVPRAVTLSRLRSNGSVRLGDVTIHWETGVHSALDTAEIGQGRDVGMVRATRLVDGKAQDVVHDVTFAFVYHAFHPDGTLLH